MAKRKPAAGLALVFGKGGSGPPEPDGDEAEADDMLDDDPDEADAEDVAIIQDPASTPADVAMAIRSIAGRV